MSFFFFFNDTATTEIYTLSLHDALPICTLQFQHLPQRGARLRVPRIEVERHGERRACLSRSEEHTSELQSRLHLVCRLLLEKKKKKLELRDQCTREPVHAETIRGGVDGE